MQKIECFRSDTGIHHIYIIFLCLYFLNIFLLKTYVQNFSSYVSDGGNKDELLFAEGKY